MIQTKVPPSDSRVSLMVYRHGHWTGELFLIAFLRQEIGSPAVAKNSLDD
jgi:hypothetical protein